MNNEELIDVKTLRPFRRFIYTIGELPSSYLMSMTYEEQLIWFCNYLEKTVIPTIDNNGLAVEELQAKYIELKAYVDNYFDNLDVQEEINNKLDEMAESGELADIIAQYLQLAGVLAYNTTNDLSEAPNIVNGSICKTLGDLTYNDGKGGFYKIRTITSGDIVDGFNIVALDISNTLIAERMPNYYINEINTKISALQKGKINEEIIIVGDSYLEGVGTTNPATDNFGYLLMQKLDMTTDNFHIWAEGGSSFTNPGSQGHNWNGIIEARKNEVVKENITKILLVGGYNDINASGVDDINTAISNTLTTIKNTFPNAKIYVSLIGNNGAKTSDGATARRKLKSYIYRCYCNVSNYGGIFIDKGQLPLQDYTLYEDSANKVHPNNDGNIAIANYLYQALMYETTNFIKESAAYNFTSIGGYTGTVVCVERINNENIELSLLCESLIGTFNTGENSINFGQQDLKYLRYTPINTGSISSMAFIRIGNNSTNVYHKVPALVYVNSNNELVMQFENTFSGETINKIIINWTTFILEANRN